MMQALHIKTPVLVSRQDDQTVYFKLETCQPGGSFKIRGIGHLCQKLASAGSRMFVSVSGGNAGIAVAYAGQALNIPTVVFIPETSHPVYLAELSHYGAQVIRGGKNVSDLLQQAQIFCQENQADFIHPFEDPLIWKGHSSIIDELIQDLPTKPDVALVAVGGGGLACGLLEGMHRHDWHDIPLITVETKGADCFYRSVMANQIVRLDQITSQATSLGATSVSPKLWDWRKHHEIIPKLVSDAEAKQACIAFAQNKRVLVELAAGAPLSLIYPRPPSLASYKNILVIVCGGVNTKFFNI